MYCTHSLSHRSLLTLMVAMPIVSATRICFDKLLAVKCQRWWWVSSTAMVLIIIVLYYHYSWVQGADFKWHIWSMYILHSDFRNPEVLVKIS